MLQFAARAARLALIVPVLLLGCTSAVNAPPSAGPTLVVSPSPSPLASAAPSPTPTPNLTPQLLPGKPVPPALEGYWRYDRRSLQMWLTGNDYTLDQPDQTLTGNVVVNRDEIDFFNAVRCGMPLPGGVGRYHWKITGNKLLLTPIARDPCGRREYLENVTFTRA